MSDGKQEARRFRLGPCGLAPRRYSDEAYLMYDGKKEVLAFLQKLHEAIEADRIIAKHVRVLISDAEVVIGNGVLLQASPDPAEITDTIYMCQAMLCGLRDYALKTHADNPKILTGFRAFMADIERQILDGGVLR